MTRIGNTDQVLLVLRAQLQRLERARSKSAGRAGGSRSAAPRPVERLHGLAALDQLSDEDFRRTMVRALLTEEMGEAVANDPAFQIVVDDVFRILSDNEEGRALIERAERQLRSES